MERRGGAFTFDVDVKSEQEGEKWNQPKKPVRSYAGNRMEVDAMDLRNQYEALWQEEEEDEESWECGGCSPFHRP